MELNAIESLVKELIPDHAEPNNTYNAVVSQIDNDGTVWVNVAGGTIDTPTASKSSEVEVGDNVTVEWRANKLYIAGNATNPSAGVSRVDAVERATEQARTAAQSALQDAGIAREAAESAQADAQSASTAATQAQNSLKSVVQGATTVEKAVSVMQTALEAVVEYDPTTDTVQEYFWHDANGAHVLGDTSGYRNDIDSNGMKIVTVSDEESVAEFGADGAVIGKTDGSQSYLSEDYHSLQMIDKEGETYFWASDLRDSEGKVTEYFTGDGATTEFNLIRAADSYAHRDVTITIDGVETTAWNVRVQTFVFNTAPADGAVIAIKYLPISTNLKGYSIGYRKENSTIGGYSVVEGDDNVASGYASHAEGRGTEASGNESHAEGWGSIASGGRSHAEGNDSIASGECSHAEGEDTFASGRASHAEGRGFGGQGAEGDYSHVEGYHTRATGECSHAQNEGTRALSDAQTALGKYNVADANDTYAVIIGNGSSGGSRSNALTVDWNGNVDIAGSYKVNGVSLIDLFYPVGSYYETSDANFDPNTAWGGTWSLEAGGLVHIGAGAATWGTNYAIGTIDGHKDAIIPYHRHSYTAPPSNTGSHTLTLDEIPSHSHSFTYAQYKRGAGTATASALEYSGSTKTTDSKGGGSGHSHTISGSSSNTGYAGTSGNLTDANMQPYVVVNRWHRTA